MTGGLSDQRGTNDTEFDCYYKTLPSRVFRFASDGVMLTDGNRVVIDINPAFETITGYNRDEIIGLTPNLLSSDIHSKQFYRKMNDDLNKNRNWAGDIWNRHKDGSIYLEQLSITVILDNNLKPAYYLGILRDITAQRASKDKLRRESLYDPLTELPNRKLLSEKIEKSTEFAKLNQRTIGIFFLDLDGFKEVNDNLGHDIGDKALVEIAKNLKQCLRDEDMIARLGGDEFAGVIFNLENKTDCLPILHRMLQVASEPFKIQLKQISISASIGVSFYTDECTFDGEQLLRQADFAMYQAKQKGKNTIQLFDEVNETKQVKSNALLSELAEGIRNNEVVLFYQPKLNMVTNEITGVEALVRWEHPNRGLLSPGYFLPLIEEHPLSIELGYWVIETALKQTTLWKKQGLDIPISVNITSKQLHQDDFIANLMQLLTVYSTLGDPLLELEIVESSVIYDIDKVANVIQQCRELGIMVSLDDFGSGYSSLPYLRKLPVSKLKVDRSFTQNILTSTADLSIIEAVMALASAFNCQVIAEGVENEEQGLLLMKIGCEEVQGFYVAKPMPRLEFLEWYKYTKNTKFWTYQKKLNQESMLLTYAVVEHRGWMKRITGYVQGKSLALPELNHESCLFCVWYNRSSCTSKALFMQKQVFIKHQLIHDRTKELLSIKEMADKNYILQELRHIQDLSSNFIELLEDNIDYLA